MSVNQGMGTSVPEKVSKVCVWGNMLFIKEGGGGDL